MNTPARLPIRLRPVLVMAALAMLASPIATPASAADAPVAPAGTAAPTPPTTPAASATPTAAPAAAALAPPAAASAPGNVTGTVTTSPKESASSAVVYIEGAPIEATATMTATISNKMMKFLPYLVVIPQGGKVTFRNDDPFPHNVFSADGDKFNLGNLDQGASKGHVFKSAGAYSIQCNVHPTMQSFVVVSPSSYFAKADSKGAFTIKNVPAGTYKVTAWAPYTKPSTQSVTINGADVPVSFDLHK